MVASKWPILAKKAKKSQLRTFLLIIQNHQSFLKADFYLDWVLFYMTEFNCRNLIGNILCSDVTDMTKIVSKREILRDIKTK